MCDKANSLTTFLKAKFKNPLRATKSSSTSTTPTTLAETSPYYKPPARMTAQMAAFLKLTLVGDGGVGKVQQQQIKRTHQRNSKLLYLFYISKFLINIFLFKLKSCLILQYMYGDVIIQFFFVTHYTMRDQWRAIGKNAQISFKNKSNLHGFL